MPFEFKCRNCGKVISVTILQPGEQAYCQKCHTINIVPDKEAQYDETPVGRIPGDPKLHAPIPGQSMEKKGVAVRSVTEVVGETFNVYFSLIWKILILNGIAILPALVVMFIVLDQLPQLMADNPSDAFGLVLFSPLFGLSFLYGIFVGPIIDGAVFYIIACSYVDKNPSITHAIKTAFTRSARLIPVSFLGYIVILLVSLIPFIGVFFGVYIGIIWTLTTGAVMLDDRGILASFRRSIELVDDYWWSIFGVFFLFLLIFFIPMVAMAFIPTFVSILIFMIFTPIYLIVEHIIYFNQRAIKEGYTNEQLREDIERLEAQAGGGKLF